MGFSGWLQLLLIALKIMGYLEASWLVVLIPTIFLTLVVLTTMYKIYKIKGIKGVEDYLNDKENK